MYKCFCAGYLVKNKKVLLIHNKKYGFWVPPGGHMEDGETPAETIEREFMEELGLAVRAISPYEFFRPKKTYWEAIPLPFQMNLNRDKVFDSPRIGFCYLVRLVGKQGIKLQVSEVSQARWFSLVELKAVDAPQEVKAMAKKAIKGF